MVPRIPLRPSPKPVPRRGSRPSLPPPNLSPAHDRPVHSPGHRSWAQVCRFLPVDFWCLLLHLGRRFPRRRPPPPRRTRSSLVLAGVLATESRGRRCRFRRRHFPPLPVVPLLFDASLRREVNGRNCCCRRRCYCSYLRPELSPAEGSLWSRPLLRRPPASCCVFRRGLSVKRRTKEDKIGIYSWGRKRFRCSSTTALAHNLEGIARPSPTPHRQALPP